MKVGVIGTGNMGTILIEALIDGKAISPSNLIIINRTIEKAEKLKQTYKDIKIEKTIHQVINQADIIFICVKPNDIYSIVHTNKKLFTKEKCLVSITSPIPPMWLEKIVPSSCARIIPSITNRALSGVTLFTFGDYCSPVWKEKLIELFTPISTPIQIGDDITRITSDIVSCGPAFISYITRRMIEAAVSETAIDHDTATTLVEHMLIGLGDLLKKDFYSLPTLEKKVSVKGGITGEGIKILETEMQGVFEKVFTATQKKYADEVKMIAKKFP